SLDKALPESGKNLDLVLFFSVSDDVVIKRLSGRRVCKACNKIYHVENMPSKIDGVCDSCQGLVYQRDDDMPDTIKNRIKIFYDSTSELIDFYRNKGILKELDGGKDKEELFVELKSFFSEKGYME
ncbi:MAG: nucleoside monophosphate kinase, partial [Candidatus Omnitrophica bacterium]|nr:nucleoside monophosphate kinase [Candidatus Omnitrophota bacterium]